MVNPHASQEPARQRLSALMDGALPAHQASDLLAAWSSDADMRADWHAYQLTGDVLRSEDLILSADRDARFLARLRTRLATEPVPMAATPWIDAAAPAAALQVPAASGAGQPALARRKQRWMVPSAIAAGFVAVAGVAVVLGVGQSTQPTAGQMASTAGPANGLVRASGTTMLRDARLDRYMQAHRKQGYGLAVAGAGAEGAQVQVLIESR